MNKNPITRYGRAALKSICAVAVLSIFSNTVGAEARGDGRLGPLVFHDDVLNQSLAALNHLIQDKYSQEELLAGLSEPQAPDFATAALASGAVPDIEETPEVGAFGYLVSDGNSLDNGLSLFNTEVALRGTNLFIRIAQEATSKGEAFSMAAAGAIVDGQLAQYRQEMADAGEGFGDPVNNGRSLEMSVAAINQRIFDLELRENRLAAAVPAVDGSQFDRVMISMAISF